MRLPAWLAREVRLALDALGPTATEANAHYAHAHKSIHDRLANARAALASERTREIARGAVEQAVLDFRAIQGEMQPFRVDSLTTPINPAMFAPERTDGSR